MIDVLRFGKKIDYSSAKMTNDMLMQEHLKQIREKLQMQKNYAMNKKQEE